MGEEELEKIYNLLDILEKRGKNKPLIKSIRRLFQCEEYELALKKLKKLKRIEDGDEDEESEDDEIKQVENNLETNESIKNVRAENGNQKDVEIKSNESSSENELNSESESNSDNEFNLDNEITPENETKSVNESNEESNTDTESKKETIVNRFQDSDDNKTEEVYPKELKNPNLERTYIGMLLNNPKIISMYYILYDECAFEDPMLLNLYKSILFLEGQAYASEKAKRGFNFAKDTYESNQLKYELKDMVQDIEVDPEKTYTELKKLFVLRRNYLNIPIQEIKDTVRDIIDYKLYNKMTVEEVEEAVEQVCATSKFKKAILNEELTDFLLRGDNNLTNGLSLPFPILSSVFKGMRQGETMAFAMPSNAGKSRFTINLASNVAFIHKKKVLIISNEMSEEKMRLCLITTILNNPEIQKLHGQKLSKTEGELLEFKFRPDDPNSVKVDENGFVMREEHENQKQFVKRLAKISTEFNKTVAATDWLSREINNSIYFANITDHTNDELKKIIMNYYYKEKIEYVFYDTLKTDTANIGIGEELKKTATILSNIAQNFNIFIGATLQLSETETLPINLTIKDLAVSMSVKEVLDTLCLAKQIHRDNLGDYEYSLEEVDTKFFDLEKFKDPDVRYYACVVDKNRAGAKPKVLFRLNLAYNRWEELGYLSLKQGKNEEIVQN